MDRLKAIQDKEKAPKLNQGTAKKFVRNALWSPEDNEVMKSIFLLENFFVQFPQFSQREKSTKAQLSAAHKRLQVLQLKSIGLRLSYFCLVLSVGLIYNCL